MKSISIRDLRQRWPEAEAALESESEILITRDSKPVAKLVKYNQEPPRRKRWNPDTHGKWQKTISGGATTNSTEDLAKLREDRISDLE